MDKIKVVHDAEGQTLAVWLDDPAKETVCEETAEEVVLIKDATARVIGFEVLRYRPADTWTPAFAGVTNVKKFPAHCTRGRREASRIGASADSAR